MATFHILLEFIVVVKQIFLKHLTFWKILYIAGNTKEYNYIFYYKQSINYFQVEYAINILR